MRFVLQPHPDGPSPAIAIAAEVRRLASDTIALVYRVTGAIEGIVVPPPVPAEPRDNLWQHSCFEAFVRPGGEDAYIELNLSPSTQWAAYRFDGYRSGMRVAALGQPEIEFRAADDLLELRATFRGLAQEVPWHVGLSAVIEAEDGSRSYWALRHPAGKPDFHHRDCFALELSPPARP